jgi:hypothetical protein
MAFAHLERGELTMASWIKYKIGDVFLVDLNDHGKGAGRVIKKSNDTIFVELFRVNQIQLQNDINFELLANINTINTIKRHPSDLHQWYINASYR